jgi:hypothetical protein
LMGMPRRAWSTSATWRQHCRKQRRHNRIQHRLTPHRAAGRPWRRLGALLRRILINLGLKLIDLHGELYLLFAQDGDLPAQSLRLLFRGRMLIAGRR